MPTWQARAAEVWPAYLVTRADQNKVSPARQRGEDVASAADMRRDEVGGGWLEKMEIKNFYEMVKVIRVILLQRC